jgi:hypothetical protein
MRSRLGAVAPLFVLFATSLGFAQSQDLAYSDLERRIAALENQAAVTDQPDAVLRAGQPSIAPALLHDEAVVPCRCDCCMECDAESFWYGGLELTMLNPQISNSAFGIDDGSGGVGPRLYLGWESAKGFGLRGRTWGMNMDADIVAYGIGPTPVDLAITAGRFDFDLYRRFKYDSGSFLFGAGLSSGKLEYEISDGVTTESMDTIAAGVSVFAEGKHSFYHSEVSDWAVVSRGRWAYMIGEDETTLFPGVVFDSNLNVAEAAFGVEYNRKFRRTTFVAQYLMEAQAWDASLNDDVNFLGSTVRLGFTW